MSISITKQLRLAKTNNNDEVKNAFCLATPSVTYKATPDSSTDPFSSKTNKYAESKIIAITTIAKACHVKFGAAGVGACTTSDYCIPADTTQYFAVDEAYAYLRLLENAATATVFVTEIY